MGWILSEFEFVRMCAIFMLNFCSCSCGISNQSINNQIPILGGFHLFHIASLEGDQVVASGSKQIEAGREMQSDELGYNPD